MLMILFYSMPAVILWLIEGFVRDVCITLLLKMDCGF